MSEEAPLVDAALEGESGNAVIYDDPMKQVFDAVVIGTGITEAIVAGALSRIGKTVLHLDKHDYYGGDDASFGLEEFVAWHAGLPSDGAWVPFVKSADGSAPASLPAVLAPVARRFSLDISPRAVSSRGEMVDLLVASETTHYLDFKVIDSLHVLHGRSAPTDSGPRVDPRIQKVPASKADVFQSGLGPLDKRRLMKFIQFCMDKHVEADAGVGAIETLNEVTLGQGRSLTRPQNKSTAEFDTEGFTDRPFVDFLLSCSLSPELQAIVAYAVAGIPMCQSGFVAAAASPTAAPVCLPTRLGMEWLQRRLMAIGRYSATPYILSMYGSSELSQAFCRAAAVGGAIYMLCVGPASVESVEEGEGTDASPIFRLTTTDTEGATVVRCKNIITASSYLSYLTTSPLPGAVRAACARAVCVVRGAVIASAERCILTISPNTLPFNNPSPVFMWQLDSSSGACPTGYTVLYLSTLCVKAAAASAFEPVENDQSAEIGEAHAALEVVVRQLTREMPSAVSPEPDAAVAVTADDEDTRGEDMGLEPSPVVDSPVGIDEPAAGEKPWLLWSAFYTQLTYAFPDGISGSGLHIAAASTSVEQELLRSLLPLDVNVEQLIARRIVGSLEPEAPFFPPPQNSAFRRAQMQDEEDEM